LTKWAKFGGKSGDMYSMSLEVFRFGVAFSGKSDATIMPGMR
jgi:hypothetical protein